MKNLLIIAVLGFIFVAIVPFSVISFGCQKKEDKNTILVYHASEDRIFQTNLNQYLKEVTAAEMPANFHLEAQKAQAVAARTFFKKRSEKSFEEHKGADICTDFRHCCAWKSEEDFKKDKDETLKNTLWEKISRSVDETSLEVVTFQCEFADTLFHSASSGITESAEDVWGSHVPYLINVKSEGDENAPSFFYEKTVTKDEFLALISDLPKNVDFSDGLFSGIERTRAGGIRSLTVGGVKIKGTTLREFFSLKSTNAELYFDGENVRFQTVGNGHGVGMSQYGANYMANNGATYRDILQKYYPGTELSLMP